MSSELSIPIISPFEFFIFFLNINSKLNSFEISGLDLGDNLLDKLTLNYINNNTRNYNESNNDE